MTGSKLITIQAQQLTLLPQRAVFWHEREMLIIADPHFGKAAAFRRRGLAIPGGTTTDDLKRLDQAITNVDARTLLILGDLLHAPALSGNDLILSLSRWRTSHPQIELILIKGNHDRGGAVTIEGFDLHQALDSVAQPPFTFVHQPHDVAGTYVVSGHLHPAVQLSGPGRQRECLPCFYFGPRYAVLPSFGGFTGHHTIRPRAGDAVFVIADNCVIQV